MNLADTQKNKSNPFGVNFVTREKFHELVTTQGPTENIAIHQPFVADEIKVADDGSRKVTFTISTEAVDRDRDIIKASGWKLQRYKQNPVVLWAHQYWDPPIAKAEKIGVQNKQLVSVGDFVPGEVWPFAEAVYQMLKLKVLRAASVGFMPIEHQFDEERRGVNILKAELLEWSVVPVPSNPEALMQARSIMKGTPPMKAYIEWCERFLDEHHGGKGVWVSQDQVAAVFKFMNDKTMVPVTQEIIDEIKSVITWNSVTKPGDPPKELAEPTEKTEAADDTEDDEPVLKITEPDVEPVFSLIEHDEPKINIDPDEINRELRNMILERVGTMAANAIRNELNYARGVVD